MKSIVKRAKSFLKSEDGPTATEYAVMLALIIVVSIAVGIESGHPGVANLLRR